MNTLLVHYGPGNPSTTREVVKAIKKLDMGQNHVEELDLTQENPDLFGPINLQAYVERNYKGQEITLEEKQSLSKMDRMTEQLLNSDILIMVFPMYNFSIPASIKAWIDSVAQAKKAFKYTEYGPVGLVPTKLAIIIPITGTTPQNSSKDFITEYMKVMMNFMGVENIIIPNQGYASKYLNRAEVVDSIIEAIKPELENNLSLNVSTTAD